MDYTARPYNYEEVHQLKMEIFRGINYGFHSYFGTPALREEFIALFHDLLAHHRVCNAARFEAVRALTILRWRARWFDRVEMQYMAAEGQRFNGYPKSDLERAHPDLTMFSKTTGGCYPWLLIRIRTTTREVERAERRLARLQKHADSDDAAALRRTAFHRYQGAMAETPDC
jgi:hypothetical protein